MCLKLKISLLLALILSKLFKLIFKNMSNKKIKISQIQFEARNTPLENANLLERLFKRSIKFEPDLICTPECSNIITNDKSHLLKYATFQEDCPILKMTKFFAKKNKVNINIGSLLLKIKNKKKLVNRSILINKKGKIQDSYDKINLFDVNISKKENHRESHFFIKGNKLVLSKILGIKIGFTICYDLRFPDMFRKYAKSGAKIILMPAAFTIPTGKAHWETLIRARAIENSIFVIATNMCGTHHSRRKTYGHSMLCNPWGEIIKKCSSKTTILNSMINLNEVSTVRSKIPSVLNG